jgi:MFS family permease
MSSNYFRKIFLILMLDLLAYSAIFPLLPLLFLDAKYFLAHFSHSQKVFLLGLLYASYPLFQMLMSPVWVKLADKIGRKKMLQLSFIGNCLGYLVSSLALVKCDFKYLFFGQAIAGTLGVNLSTINALISDFTSGSKRIKYFGLVNLILGAAFALGPYLSSLIVPKIPHIESITLMTFMTAAVISVVNLFLISSIKAPLPHGVTAPKTKIDLSGIKKEAIYPLFVIFLTTFAWNIFIKTFQIFLLEIRQYAAGDVLKMVSFYGLSTLVVQGVFVTKLYKKINPRLGLYTSLLGLGVAIALFVISPGVIGIHIHILFIAFFQSLITPNLLAIFSQNHTQDNHGKMMSAHLGVVSLAKILAPATSGLLVAISPGVSLLTSSLVILGSILFLPLLFVKKQQDVEAF